MNPRIEILTWSALVLVGLDALTTTYALTELAGAAEANPAIAAVMGTIGVIPTMLAKILIGTVVATVLARWATTGYPKQWMRRNWRFKRITLEQSARRAWRMLALLAILHGIVVINNTLVIAKYS